jgi:hypothetical protein
LKDLVQLGKRHFVTVHVRLFLIAVFATEVAPVSQMQLDEKIKRGAYRHNSIKKRLFSAYRLITHHRRYGKWGYGIPCLPYLLVLVA